MKLVYEPDSDQLADDAIPDREACAISDATS